MKSLLTFSLFTFALLWNSAALSLTPEQLEHENLLSKLAKERCDSEQIDGHDYTVKLIGDGKVEVSFFGKKGGEIKGKFIYNRSEWEGRQRVLREHQAGENTDRRKCIKDEMKSLRESYKPPISELYEDNVKITSIRCGNDRWVYIDILINSNKSGIQSYILFPTWGGGGDISKSFLTPLPKRVEKTLLFRQPSRDPYTRDHQFGLKVKFGLHGSVEKYAGRENTFEPSGRCEGT